MADMIKFYKGLAASLPATGVNGALYITTDEGAIYLGTGAGMKRLGDFIQVDNVAALPAAAHESCLYYCVAENILAKWNGTEWKQINKQPTAAELKTLLGLKSLAYKDEADLGLGSLAKLSVVSESNLSTELAEKVNAASEGNHAHLNKGVLDGISAEKVAAWDAAEQNAKDYADGLAGNYDAAGAAAGAAAGVKTELSAEIAKKVDAVDGKSLVADGEITKLAGVSAGANKVEASSNGYIKIDGVDTLVYTHPDKHAIDDVTGLQSALDLKLEAAAIAGKADKTYVDGELAKYTLTTAQQAIDSAQNTEIAAVKTLAEAAAVKSEVETALSERYTKTEADGKFALKGADAYDDTEVRGLITAEANRATGIEAGLRTDVDAIKGDYLKAADKTELEGKIKSNADAIALLTNGADPDTVDGVNDLIAYVAEHGTEVTGMKADIKKNADDIAAINNHSHSFVESELELIKAGDVALWNGEIGAKELANGVKTVVDTNKATWDKAGTALQAADLADLNAAKHTHTFADADVVAAIQAKHTHGFVEDELDKIAAGDVAKWNAEIGAKELAASKTTTAEVKAQIEAYGYATEADLTLAEGRIKAIEDDYLKGADKTALQAEIDADVKVVSDALAEHVKVDHNFAAADAALKSELQAEIDADVKVVSDALGEYKTANNAAVALKANSEDVYAKTETFTKSEVNAAIAAAVEAAHTWGEF